MSDKRAPEQNEFQNGYAIGFDNGHAEGYLQAMTDLVRHISQKSHIGAAERLQINNAILRAVEVSGYDSVMTDRIVDVLSEEGVKVLERSPGVFVPSMSNLNK